MGHFPVICKSVPVKKVNQVLETEDDFSPTFVGEVTAPTCFNTSMAEPAANPQTCRSDPGWHVKLKIQDQGMLTCALTQLHKCLWCLRPCTSRHRDAFKIWQRTCWSRGCSSGDPWMCSHEPHLRWNILIEERVYVVRGLSRLLLGIPTIRSLGLIHEIPGTFSVKSVYQTPDKYPLRSGTKEDIVKQYPTLFQGLGRLVGEHTIHLKEGAEPFCLTTLRRVPLPLMKKVQEEIKRMEQLDVIEPLDEPTEWCSPIVVVPKADGRVRICVDLTRLNQAVRREVYQMPTVEETLGSLTEGSVFSKRDANSRFHQIVLNPESAKLTTFITPFGRYMFNRLPFGIIIIGFQIFPEEDG